MVRLVKDRDVVWQETFQIDAINSIKLRIYDDDSSEIVMEAKVSDQASFSCQMDLDPETIYKMKDALMEHLS